MYKKLLLLCVSNLCFFLSVYAQGFFSPGPFLNNPNGTGSTSIFGWGANFDNTIDARPVLHPTYGTMMINYHTGLTFSAHSYYGGIRFYNQGYPNAYDPATGSIMVMSITDGNVGIGTTDAKGYKLAVAGNMIAEQVIVKLRTSWPDYVFRKDYPLMPLSELKTYISQNNHLPEIPADKEIKEKGLDLGEMNTLLIKKVEELTLYLLEKDKQLKEQEIKINGQEERLDKFEAMLKSK